MKITSAVKSPGQSLSGAPPLDPSQPAAATNELQRAKLTLPWLPKAVDRKNLPAPSNIILLVDEMLTLLKVLPTEVPLGSEDIYQMDIGLMWRSRNLQWCNMSMSMVGKGTPGTEGFDSDDLAMTKEVMLFLYFRVSFQYG